MNDPQILDLVDRYLLRQINEEDIIRLHQLMEADPRIAQYVKEAEDTFRVLEIARYRELRRKLKTWDNERLRTQNPGKKGIWLLGVFLTILLGFWCWMGHQYASSTLADASFQKVNSDPQVIRLHPATDSIWIMGRTAFQQHNFEQAISFFAPYVDSPDALVSADARWNMLLARFADREVTPAWLEEMHAFSAQAPDPWRGEAVALLQIIHSPAYNILHGRFFQKTMSTVKPKII